MAGRPRSTKKRPNRYVDPSREINILLLGQTGVGKSTFINGLANYFCYDTMKEAVQDKMQVVIPSSFTFTNDETFEETTIQLGQADESENFNDTTSSCTQQCRSFVFEVGERNLRIIDTPGIGDTRGLDYDTKNFDDILAFISQYEHLNGVCILLKPNEERLHILFKFCINELLRHLHQNARENIIFVFTNVRTTFYKPGGTSRVLRALLNKHKEEQNVEVPFTMDNTILLDNEGFRYLALRQNGIELSSEHRLSFENSWDYSVREYSKLMGHIAKCPLHAVSNTLSLNEAEQLIRKLTRPIAETTRLIEQNLQLAEKQKQNVLRNSKAPPEPLPQYTVRVVRFDHPRTVCTSEGCLRSITVNNETKVEYLSKCHEKCYLKGVLQETIKDERMRECEAMNYKTGKAVLL